LPFSEAESLPRLSARVARLTAEEAAGGESLRAARAALVRRGRRLRGQQHAEEGSQVSTYVAR
jgi:hypothetical protein